jgi:uncharacterized protein
MRSGSEMLLNMLKINVKPDELLTIKAILKQCNPQVEVWAYGSRVGGGSHKGSDLDLVLRNENHLEKHLDKVSQLKQLFIDSDLPFLVDLMDWACLSVSFREEISKQYQII